MRAFALHPTMRALAVGLLLFQALLPGGMGVAQASGIDVGRLLCLTPGVTPSAEAQRFARMLSGLLGEEAPAEPRSENDCPLCHLAKAKALAPAVAAGPAVVIPAATPRAPGALGFVDRRNGPSLGGRAPPRAI